MINKTLGSIFVAAGTAVGAGIFALPLVSSGMGFIWASLAFFGVWAVMLFSGLLTLEVSLAFKAPANHYAAMARGTLGKGGEYFCSLAYLLLLYALLSAYISGGASMIEAVTQLAFKTSMPSWANALLFTGVLGLVVTWSTRALDYFNRLLFIFKLCLLGLVFALFLPQINTEQLITPHEGRYLWAALPVIITAFGFHIVIPSLSHYLDENVSALKKVLIYGSLIPLVIYILWLAGILGTLPLKMITPQSSVGDLMIAINQTQKSLLLSPTLNTFAQIALMTSFLGVSLALFHHLQSHRVKSRLRSSGLTFLPPLGVALFYPNGFVQLLAYASIFVAIILVILPALMAYRLRRLPELNTSYRTPGGNLALFVVLLVGIGFIVIEALGMAGILPVWMG